MAALANLEKTLSDVFVKKAPALPENGKKWIVQYLPWITVALAVLSLWEAYTLWHWAHWANAWTDYANSISSLYGGPTVDMNRLSAGIWLSLAIIVVEAFLCLAAFPALRAHKKDGWNLLFYVALIDVLYGVVTIFTDYGGAGNLFWSIVGAAVGLYLLFQIRDRYLGTTPSKATTVPSKKA